MFVLFCCVLASKKQRKSGNCIERENWQKTGSEGLNKGTGKGWMTARPMGRAENGTAGLEAQTGGKQTGRRERLKTFF